MEKIEPSKPGIKHFFKSINGGVAGSTFEASGNEYLKNFLSMRPSRAL
jgi:hypothetical protein